MTMKDEGFGGRREGECGLRGEERWEVPECADQLQFGNLGPEEPSMPIKAMLIIRNDIFKTR